VPIGLLDDLSMTALFIFGCIKIALCENINMANTSTSRVDLSLYGRRVDLCWYAQYAVGVSVPRVA